MQEAKSWAGLETRLFDNSLQSSMETSQPLPPLPLLLFSLWVTAIWVIQVVHQVEVVRLLQREWWRYGYAGGTHTLNHRPGATGQAGKAMAWQLSGLTIHGLTGLLLLYTNAYCLYTLAVFATVWAKFKVFHAHEKIIIAYCGTEHGYYSTVNWPNFTESTRCWWTTLSSKQRHWSPTARVWKD